MISVKKQIIVQESLESLVGLLPEFSINDTDTKKAYFDFGNENEISRTIQESNGSIYPLIWMLPSPSVNNLRSNRVSVDLQLIVATLENRIELFNKDRLENSFKKTLFPIRDYLIHVLRNSGISEIKSEEVTTYEFPRYIEADKSISIDNWDAIRIEVNIELNNNNCLKAIKWKI